MELEQLRMFVAAAEAGGFSQAGRRLYTSHSTVSRAVSALEKELGLELMTRGSRGLSLTTAGFLLLSEGRQLLSQADSLAEKLAGLKQG